MEKETIRKWLGLNNKTCPVNTPEGTAYVSDAMRVDESGQWSVEPSVAGATAGVTTVAISGTGNYKYLIHGGGTPVMKVAIVGTTIVADTGTDGYIRSCANTGGAITVKDGESTFSRPTEWATPPALSNTAGSRMANGTYYYMYTLYDSEYHKRETLPSWAYALTVTGETNEKAVLLTAPTIATDTGYDKIRVYRSFRTNADDDVYNPTSKFYFIAELATTGIHTDLAADGDIADYEYDGRGTPSTGLSACTCLVSYNNRMLYFEGSTLYWSNTDAPDNLALEYTLTYDAGGTVKVKPKLCIGRYGEAKYIIQELLGQKVIAARVLKGKCYIWTESKMGYLETTSRLEGFRYRHLYDDVGVTTEHTLALSPHGLFGADVNGIWLYTSGHPRRLMKNRIDIDTSTKSTYINIANRVTSFGVWVPGLEEYWWGKSSMIIAYQADRDMFAGPYDYALTGGCTVVNSSGAQAYVGGYTPSLTAQDTAAELELQLWLGQDTPFIVKDQLTVELMSTGTAGTRAVEVVQAETFKSSTEGKVTKSFTTLVNRVSPSSSGRMFRVKITAAANAAEDCKLAALNYRYNPIDWTKEAGR